MIIAMGLVLTALLVLSAMRWLAAPRPMKDTGLGWVSERWLDEHRAAESSPLG